jgi:hypothetical protein
LNLAEGSDVSQTPIFVLGCPRTGTRLVSRILGRPERCFLITEHNNKARCPEDRSGIVDSLLWWNIFEFESWNSKFNRPSHEIPIMDADNLARLKAIYVNLAGDRRLVVKNPSNLVRIPLIKKMFPDAKFVFCVRNPWQTISSISQKAAAGKVGHEAFHLRTPALLALGNDFLLRATHSWSEAIELYSRHKDETWTTVRYEDVVHNPQSEIDRLYQALGIDDERANRAAVKMRRKLEHNYFAVKKLYETSPFKAEIDEMLACSCEIFSYSPGFESLNVSSLRHFREQLTAKRALKVARRIAVKPFSRSEKATDFS